MKKPSTRLALHRITVRVLGHSISEVAGGQMVPKPVTIAGPSQLNSCVAVDCASWSCLPDCQ
jgi:hypothetical protein